MRALSSITASVLKQMSPLIGRCFHFIYFAYNFFVQVEHFKALVYEVKWSEVKVTQSCLTLCNPMDYTVHGILQARILEWVAFPFSRGSSQPRNRSQVSCIAGGFFTSWATNILLLKLRVNSINIFTQWDYYMNFLCCLFLIYASWKKILLSLFSTLCKAQCTFKTVH